MAYCNKNHVNKQRHAAELTALHYEPGRHDRCYKWVWRKFIRDQFHVEYPTYLAWLRAERKRQQAEQDAPQLTLF